EDEELARRSGEADTERRRVEETRRELERVKQQAGAARDARLPGRAVARYPLAGGGGGPSGDDGERGKASGNAHRTAYPHGDWEKSLRAFHTREEIRTDPYG